MVFASQPEDHTPVSLQYTTAPIRTETLCYTPIPEPFVSVLHPIAPQH